ncbi:MAG: tetratricopeptide repeat protein [Saprospiraceae bacterium]|nr:tetratricopeptide repeat protein [Saprospiraceae bacterium]
MQHPTHLRHLLSSARTAEALEQLTAWAESQGAAYRQAALLLQASWASNEQQTNSGLIANEEAELIRNRISAGALGLIDEIESGASAPKAVLEGLQKQFLNEQVAAVMQEGNATDLSDSNIEVQDSKDVVIGSGNVITKKKIAGLARGQFFALVLGILVLIIGGYYGLGALQGGQASAYSSLLEIQKELKLRGDLDAEVNKRLEANKADIDKWLAEAMAALKNKDYATAVPYLEKVAEQAPLATVRQNLAYAYEQLGNADKARENLEAAKKINPNLDTSKSYAQLKGKRINLLAPENGRIFVGGSNDRMEKLIDGLEREESLNTGSELIVAFKDNRAASFDQLAMLIVETSGFNTNEFELFAGNDSPTGKFESLGKFTTQNLLLTQNRYQEFTFPKVTAKYFKYKILTSHGGSTYYPHGMEIQLWGELQ